MPMQDADTGTFRAVLSKENSERLDLLERGQNTS